MKIIALALLVLIAFLAVWFLIVVPAERRHHERKLAIVKKKIERRQSSDADESDENEISGTDERGEN